MRKPSLHERLPANCGEIKTRFRSEKQSQGTNHETREKNTLAGAAVGDKKDRLGETTGIRFQPCGLLDFESAAIAQNDEYKAVLIASFHVR